MSFNASDLEELDSLLLARADSVVAMHDVYQGRTDDRVIGLRHDVDDNQASLETAVKLAGWEAERGYRSTYFILHTAAYWDDEPRLRAALDQIAVRGHEIGIHADALTVALREGGDPAAILIAAITQLRGYGHPVYGVAGHGGELCGQVGFVNDEIFSECARPEMGAPDRILTFEERTLRLAPRPLADFGLVYETYRLPRRRYLSDSGDHWNIRPARAADGPGQLHILMHPDWWEEAFS